VSGQAAAEHEPGGGRAAERDAPGEREARPFEVRAPSGRVVDLAVEAAEARAEL
jgi:hypothetical protein